MLHSIKSRFHNWMIFSSSINFAYQKERKKKKKKKKESQGITARNVTRGLKFPVFTL